MQKEYSEWIQSWCDCATCDDLPRILLIGDSITRGYQAFVREKLKNLQRSLAEKQRIVMEGRDIGSVVFPDAQWKFFVTASPEVRAKRRLDQSKETYSSATLEEIARSIAERDRIDSQRPIAPLKQCEDAILVDSSGMNVDETVAFIAERIK